MFLSSLNLSIFHLSERATLEEKLKFVKDLIDEREKLSQAHKISLAFQFSYFELLQLLGLSLSSE